MTFHNLYDFGLLADQTAKNQIVLIENSDAIDPNVITIVSSTIPFQKKAYFLPECSFIHVFF